MPENDDYSWLFSSPSRFLHPLYGPLAIPRPPVDEFAMRLALLAAALGEEEAEEQNPSAPPLPCYIAKLRARTAGARRAVEQLAPQLTRRQRREAVALIPEVFAEWSPSSRDGKWGEDDDDAMYGTNFIEAHGIAGLGVDL